MSHSFDLFHASLAICFPQTKQLRHVMNQTENKEITIVFMTCSTKWNVYWQKLRQVHAAALESIHDASNIPYKHHGWAEYCGNQENLLWCDSIEVPFRSIFDDVSCALCFVASFLGKTNGFVDALGARILEQRQWSEVSSKRDCTTWIHWLRLLRINVS